MSRAYDVVSSPVIALMHVGMFAFTNHVSGWTAPNALGSTALIAGVVAAVVAFIAYMIMDDNSSELVDDVCMVSGVACLYAACATALAGIWLVAPPVLATVCATLLFILGVYAYFGLQVREEYTDWTWGWRKALLPLALLAGFGVWQYTGNWAFAGFALIVVLMVQFFWTIHLWVRPARVPA
ncbi:MAG: hypothetical protein AAB480_01810 [Patescibacteria group bacterium]